MCSPSGELQVATTVLLLEVIRADLRVMDTELRVVDGVIRGAFHLFPEEAAKLLKKAEEYIDKAKEEITLTAPRTIRSSLFLISDYVISRMK